MQMLMTSPNHIPATRRMHVGKEFEQFESIDWYDNEARFYDPLLVRFTTPDPLALSYPSLSPYAYCANNSVNKALGEVEPGEPTRINHFGTPIIVGSPNSTEPISSPEIIYKRKTK